MQKNNKLIITKKNHSVLLVIILLVCGYVVQIIFNNITQLRPNDTAAKNKHSQIIKKISDTVSSFWYRGGFDRLSKKQKKYCSQVVEFKNMVTNEFYNCNPIVLDCFLHDYNYLGYRPLKFKNNYYRFARNGDPIVTFAKDANHLFSIQLHDSCADVYLPEKKYSAGPVNEDKYIWDNLNQNVYIDKYYVSNLDVYLWKTRQKIPFTERDKQLLKKPYLPSTGLSSDQKHLYCYHHGKKVLESRYFDAASFLPSKELNPKYIYKFPFHWTKKRYVEQSKCYHIYARGCESEREYKFYEGLSTSWSGVHFALGNYMEYLPNKFNKDLNLKVSSFYVNKESPWHEIGKRGTLGLTDKQYFENQQGVAFRCMAIR